MGVFPRRTAGQMYTMFKPFTDALAQHLNEEVRLIVPKNFKTFWQDVVEGKYDIVHYNQYHYVKSHKEHGYQVIVANNEFGNKKISSMIAVRKDSGYNSLADLKGKTIMFGGGKKAMMSYIIPTYLLKKANLQPGIDYQEKFAINPVTAIIATYNGHADANGNGEVILSLNKIKKRINIDEIKILAKSKPVVFLPWAVNKNMSTEKTRRIQEFMVNLDSSSQGKQILKKASVNSFYKIEDQDYNQIRELIEIATGEKY